MWCIISVGSRRDEQSIFIENRARRIRNGEVDMIEFFTSRKIPTGNA
jgi:hypothetical protein